MYSVILMAAMTANGPDAITFGRHRNGCNGCYGGCSGCYGGCSGCYGGGCWGCGGCYGGVSYGCHGSSCFGTSYGGSACYGGCYGSCIGCTGQYASWGSYNTPIWYGQQPYHPSGNPMVVPPAPAPGTGTTPKPPEAKPMSGAAKLIIDVPAGSKLFIDDLPMTVRDKPREFTTPTLEPGVTYYYEVRVEGSVSESRRVLVRSGDTLRESFGSKKPDAIVRASK